MRLSAILFAPILAAALVRDAPAAGADTPLRTPTNPFLVRRITFEEGDKAGAGMANGKDITIVAHEGAKDGRALHIKPLPDAKTSGSQANKESLRSFLGFFYLALEDGKTFVFKLRMKTEFPPGGCFSFGMDQKGAKDGQTKYFRVTFPDPAFARTHVIGGRNEWQEYSWEFTPMTTAKTECATACYIYATISGPAGTEAWIDDIELWEKPVFYQAGFAETNETGVAGWTFSGQNATVDKTTGHAAPGSLGIHADGNTKQSPYWESPAIAVSDPDVFLSCRIKDRLTFSPDPTYNVNVGILCYDKDKKPIGEFPESVSVWNGYVPDVGGSLVEGYLSSETWHYLTKKVRLPAQTQSVKLRFGLRHSYQGSDVTTLGDAWLDDIALTSGKAMVTDNSTVSYREHAWPVWDNRNMRIHTPVFMNLFLPADKLTVDVTVLSSAEALQDPADVTLEYTVEDFYHMVLLAEKISAPGFTPVPEPRLKAAGVNAKLFNGAFWKQLVLPPSLVAAETGRWLRFHCRVLKQGKTIAEGNTDLGVIRPAAPVSEAKKEFSKFAVGLSLFAPGWGACPPAEGVAPRPATYAELFGFYWKRGNYINDWAGIQPVKDGPMNWDQCEVEGVLKQGLLQRGVNNRVYMCFNSVLPHCRPAWANLPGEPVSSDSIDTDAFARFVYAVVERYKGMGIMWMPGFGETAINARQAKVGQLGYEAAKKADPAAVVFCNGVTGISVARMKQYFELGHLDFTDALDLHFYYDPYATEETLDYVQAEMKKRGQVKPIWSAEIGSFCPDLETLCKDMVKKHVIAFACGMRNVCWHAFGNPTTKKINPMWEFYYRFPEGKLSGAFPANAPIPGYNDVPLPRVFTLTNLLRDLDYVVPRNKFVAADGVRVYVFDREPPVNPDAAHEVGFWSAVPGWLLSSGRNSKQETVVSLWQHAPGAMVKGKNVALTTDRPVTVRDAFGLKHELTPDAAGRVYLPANDNPLLLTIAGVLAKLEVGDGSLRVAAPEKLNSVQPFEVRVAVASRGGRPLKGTVSLDIGLGWQIEPVSAAVRVAADKAETLTFKLTPPGDLTPGKHRLLVHFTDKKDKLVGYDEVYVKSGP